ncbi:ABC transporter permease [Isoptericola jiangsuensis]|uniref:ABC transporter permease n=1 Tax=Isoptericola jiangsuensis TaxID=548579 RepID=UPI003AACAD83
MTASPSPTLPAVPSPGSPVAPWRLAWLHLRFQFLETVRIPVAVIGNLVFPALALGFFVVPQQTVAQDPFFATTAVASLSVFAVMSSSLFSHGLGVSEDRQLPFDPFVRTLPAGPWPRMVGRIGNGTVMSLLALVPLLVVGWIFTAAAVTVVQLLGGIGTVLVVGVPFVLLGLAIGYSMPAKAAIAVVQVMVFPLAFAGGLFLPPMMFPAWLDTVSRFTPSRAGRDLVVEVTTGVPAYGGAWLVLLGWTAVFAVLAVLAYRRDEGRRFS